MSAESGLKAIYNLMDHDPDSALHSYRVAAMVMGVFDALGISGEEKQNYVIAGLLHDIGKCRIPRSILQSP